MIFTTIEYKNKQKEELKNFNKWLTWRAEHCRLEGRVDSGTFVCDNGKKYRVKFGRYNERQIYPAFVKTLPDKKSSAD